MGRAEILVVFVPFEHMIGCNQNRMSHSDDRPFASTTGGQPMIEGRQVGILGMGCRPRRLGKRAFQRLVTRTGSAAQPFARAFVIPWSHSRPRGKAAMAG